MRFEPAIGHLLGPAASAADAQRQRDAEAITDELPICLTRTGNPITVANHTVRVIQSDGVRENSGLIVTWQVQSPASADRDAR